MLHIIDNFVLQMIAELGISEHIVRIIKMNLIKAEWEGRIIILYPSVHGNTKSTSHSQWLGTIFKNHMQVKLFNRTGGWKDCLVLQLTNSSHLIYIMRGSALEQQPKKSILVLCDLLKLCHPL